MQKFDFNYQINDWKERKENVEKYIADNKILEQIQYLTIQNTVPKKYDKDNNPIEWYVQGNQELRDLKALLFKMYYYILYAIDKEMFNNCCLTKEQQEILEDAEQDIISYVDKRKRGKKTYYKEPNWAIIDIDVIEHNQDKINKFNNDFGIVVDKQIMNYKKLENKIKNMDKNELNETNIKCSDFISDLNYDAKICLNFKESINKVYISEGIRQKHDKLADVNIKYNYKLVKNILKNWKDIEKQAYNKPDSYLFCIYMDFSAALENIKLTDYQFMVLNMIIDHENIRMYSKTVKSIINKLVNELGD